jgi:putative membrane protein
MKRIGIVPIALAIAVTVAGCERGNRNTARDANGAPVGTAGTAADKVSRGDKDIVNDLAIVDMAEIELGKLAAGKAANAEVKKFGQMMVDDHTTSSEKLKSLATKYSIPLPTELDGKHRDLREELSTKQGAEFDRAYIDAMVNGHEDALDKLGSRVDKEKLGEWRTKMEQRTGARTTEKVDERAEATAIIPEKSDDPVTMEINQLAADAYPIVYMHHVKAKALLDHLKKSTTN